MKTLDDARNWYRNTSENLARMQRLGQKLWNNLPLENVSIWQDDWFKELTADTIMLETKASLQPILEDLAVVVLFSVFEALVRSYLVDTLRPAASRIVDPILKDAADEALLGIDRGSFFRQVLKPLKKQKQVSKNLVEQVDQVRKYRNWVAHGRRKRPEHNVSPQQAFERLKEFLAAVGIPEEAEKSPSNPPE